MKGSMEILKMLGFGQNFSMGSPAACVAMFERLKGSVKPEEFNPLIPIKGGMSIFGGQDAIVGMMIVNDWINRCRDAGATSKNALLCLASNYDDHPGMVALTLEAAMIALKPSSDEGMRLTPQEFGDIVTEVYLRNWAGIYSLMSEKWGVELQPDASPGEPMKTRSAWRTALGHDVLIHPITLEPCKAPDGSVLEYCGLGGTERRTEFHFKRIEGEVKRDLFRIDFPKNTA